MLYLQYVLNNTIMMNTILKKMNTILNNISMWWWRTNHCLILNNLNTQNGEIPKLGNNNKKTLQTVQIQRSSNIKSIPDRAFEDHTSLQTVCIEEGVAITTIERGAFSYCTSLKSITIIPNTVTAIEGSAFYGCRLLKSIVIPSGVTIIGKHAFQYFFIITSD